jgi:hypothetical protein
MHDMHCSQSSLSHDKPAQNVIIQAGFGVTLEMPMRPIMRIGRENIGATIQYSALAENKLILASKFRLESGLFPLHANEPS